MDDKKQQIVKPEPGDIYLDVLQQADQRLKPRPVLVLKQSPQPSQARFRFDNYVVVGLSSMLYQEVSGFDVFIEPSPSNGLEKKSLTRTAFVGYVSENLMIEYLGFIDDSVCNTVANRLASYLLNSVN